MEVKKYRRKPVIVEAIQFIFGTESDVLSFIEDGGGNVEYDNNIKQFYIETIDKKMYIDDGDYIVKGVQGEFYPVRDDVFHQLYEGLDKEG